MISLFVDVVKVPNLPANPAAFAVLTMLNAETGGTVTVNTQVYANGPDAAVIEIVDPRDLIEGLVRRRAFYLWRSFHASGLRPRFALWKINGVGAARLPKNLAFGWQKADLEDYAAASASVARTSFAASPLSAQPLGVDSDGSATRA